MREASLAGRTVLVTGASGFIGTHLLRRLDGSGARLHAVARRTLTAAASVRWWQADLGDFRRVREVLKAVEPAVLFHLASHVAGARSLDLVLPTLHSNLVSTVNLLTVAAEIGCRRILLTGSLEEPPPGDPESIPGSPYAAAKWAGSGYVRMFHALFRLPVVNLRLFMVYGPGQQDLHKLIPYVTLSLLGGQSPRLTRGEREVDWVYVDDVVDALVAAATADGVDGRTIDIGSGELVPVRGVVERLVGLINPAISPEYGALPARPFEQVRVADISRSHKLLGWVPSTPLDIGLRRTVEWYARRLPHEVRNAGS